MKTVICIIGPPRSGTSLTARLLNLAGVYLGPDDAMVPAGRWNPNGFWECRPIVALNERLLSALGGSIDSPPPRPASGWERSEAFAGARSEARALLEEMFDGQAVWGWKDPRTTSTLPFWQQLVPHMRYAICLRNPLHVALSAKQMAPPNSTRPDPFSAYRRYMAAAITHTAGRHRTFVTFESLARPSAAGLEGLWRLAGNDAPPNAAQADELRAAIEARPPRDASSAMETYRQNKLPADAAALHLMAESLALLEPSDPDTTSMAAAVDSYAASVYR